MRSQISRVTQATVGGVKLFKRRMKGRLGRFGPLQIVTFRGYGTSSRFFVSGRVVEAKGTVHRETADGTLATGEDEPLDTAWANLRATVRRFRSDEVPNAKLRVRFGRRDVETTADNEGYFAVTLDLDDRVDAGWHDVHVEIIESMAGGEGVNAKAQVLVPPDDAEFGVISDLDDTVIHSSVTDRLKMIRIVLFQNARTRIPFPGVAAFYRALKLGSDGKRTNPIFYVSKSPWNLYDLFETFFHVHEIPRGPLFLRDIHLLETRSKSLGTEQDKLSRIRKLLALYPKLPFVLIGDSGQKDPEIYRQIVLEYPDRIRAIYIRDVTSRRRDVEVHEIAHQIKSSGVPLILAEETLEAAEHAAKLGLISDRSLPEIGRRATRDEHIKETPAEQAAASSG